MCYFTTHTFPTPFTPSHTQDIAAKTEDVIPTDQLVEDLRRRLAEPSALPAATAAAPQTPAASS